MNEWQSEDVRDLAKAIQEFEPGYRVGGGTSAGAT